MLLLCSLVQCCCCAVWCSVVVVVQGGGDETDLPEAGGAAGEGAGLQTDQHNPLLHAGVSSLYFSVIPSLVLQYSSCESDLLTSQIRSPALYLSLTYTTESDFAVRCTPRSFLKIS